MEPKSIIVLFFKTGSQLIIGLQHSKEELQTIIKEAKKNSSNEINVKGLPDENFESDDLTINLKELNMYSIRVPKIKTGLVAVRGDIREINEKLTRKDIQ